MTVVAASESTSRELEPIDQDQGKESQIFAFTLLLSWPQFPKLPLETFLLHYHGHQVISQKFGLSLDLLRRIQETVVANLVRMPEHQALLVRARASESGPYACGPPYGRRSS